MLCKRIVVSMDIKHSINPVRRFDLFMRNTRRTGVLRGFQHNTEMSIGINPQSMDMRVINERVRLGEWTTVRNLLCDSIIRQLMSFLTCITAIFLSMKIEA